MTTKLPRLRRSLAADAPHPKYLSNRDLTKLNLYGDRYLNVSNLGILRLRVNIDA